MQPCEQGIKYKTMEIQTETFVKSMSYFKDQLRLAKEKEDNDEVIMYYNRQIDTLLNRYYNQ